MTAPVSPTIPSLAAPSLAESRGALWLRALCGGGAPALVAGRTRPSVRVADAPLGADTARFIAVVPDPDNRYPRARTGEVGLEQGWTLARLVRDTIAADAAASGRRPIVAIVDVTSQAYGRREEMLGIHMACAAAADAYAQARLGGHPVVALLVGKAMSGAFLAHGYQANRLVALDDPGVLVHAMGKQAAARITRRTVADLDALGESIPPMSYDVRTYAKLGLLHALVSGVDADAPTPADVATVTAALAAAVADIRSKGARDLGCRLPADGTGLRAASAAVRHHLAQQWDA